jgi:intein/homing endonuclease
MSSRRDPVFWLPAFKHFIKLVKVPSKELEEPAPITLYRAQEYFLDKLIEGLENDIHFFVILKARQLGISSIAVLFDLFWQYLHPGLQGAFIMDTAENKEIFRETIEQMLDSLPPSYKIPVKAHNRTSLVLQNRSRLQYLGAGRTKNSNLGRSRGLNFCHGCVTPDTPVITGDGRIKPIEMVNVGDRVLTHNGHETTIIAAVQKPNTKGDLIRITPWLGEGVSFTADHKIPTKRGLIAAGEVQKDDWLVMPVRTVTCEQTSIVLGLSKPRPQHGGTVGKGSGGTVELNEEFGFFCGYYLAEGSIIRQSWGEPSGVLFARHRDEIAYADRACAAVADIASRGKTVDRQNCLTSTDAVYGTPLANWLVNTFGCTDEKHIPDLVFAWGLPFCRGLLAGLLSGDGSKFREFSQGHETPRLRLSSTRASIAAQARDIAAALGMGWGGMSFRDAGQIRGRNCKAQWTVSWTGSSARKLRALIGLPMGAASRRWGNERYRIEGGSVWLKIRKIETGIKCSAVWDLSVPHDDHTFRTPYMAIGNSETAFWGDPDGFDALVRSLSEVNPNRLYLFESTANGFNHFEEMWREAKQDPAKMAIFIGWWAKDTYVIEEGSAQFDHWWGSQPYLSGEEQDRCGQVKELYGWGLTLEQIAWYRKQEFDMSPEMLRQELPSCVAGETRVGTDAGLIRIDQAVQGMEATLGSVLAAGPTGNAPMWRMKTALGYELTGTADHPIALVGGGFVGLKESAGSRIRLQPPRLASSLYTVRWKEGVVECAVPVTPEFARFVGLFMGDGSAYGNGRGRSVETSIACTREDADLVAEVQRLFSVIFGVDTSARPTSGPNKGGVVVRTGSTVVMSTLRKLGLAETNGTKTKRKVHVPEFIFRSPPVVVAEFLKGLFEADGFVSRDGNSVKLFTKYPEFMKDVQLLLLSFGITSRWISVVKHTEGKNFKQFQYVGHELSLRQAEAKEFLNKIGFISARKNGRLALAGVEKVQRFRRPLPLLLEDTVAMVTEAREDNVWNLTVGDDHVFDAQGILTHNTEDDAFVATGSKFFAYKRITEDLTIIRSGAVTFNAYNYELGEVYTSTKLHKALSIDDLELRVWEDARKSGKYVIGVDPAFGRSENKDRSVISVWRCYADKLVQVAEYATHKPESQQVAWVVAHLAGVYRDCVVNLELYGPGYAVMQELNSLRLQLRTGAIREPASKLNMGDDALDIMRWYLYHRPDAMGAGYAYGWKTTQENKLRLFNVFRDKYNTNLLVSRSAPLLEEMTTLVQSGDSIAASGRNKDDRPFAAALACMAWDEWVRPGMMANNLTYERVQATEQLQEERGNEVAKWIVSTHFERAASERAAAARAILERW